jgi:hypothetical protein
LAKSASSSQHLHGSLDEFIDDSDHAHIPPAAVIAAIHEVVNDTRAAPNHFSSAQQ